MALEFSIGLEIITSYKRLNYSPWHALAELVDNSTQAYFDNRTLLDSMRVGNGPPLEVGIVWEHLSKNSREGILRISDNSIGMSYDDLQHALRVAHPPTNTTGRSRYGMGLKTAACWLGNVWTVRTKKLGETTEYTCVLDVDAIAAGQSEIPFTESVGRDTNGHYTVIEITQLNRGFGGRTIGQIKRYLSSMYREDLRQGVMVLKWQDESLVWEEEPFLLSRDGTEYKKTIAFQVGDKRVWGWVGILSDGSRSKAGFSILHHGRVIFGWPQAWRPTSIFGQELGSNNLINQRLIGELCMDDFEVSHTKDSIRWVGDEEEEFEDLLATECRDYATVATSYRKHGDDVRGPSTTETQVAVQELKRELESPAMVDAITLDIVPPEQVIDHMFKTLAENFTQRDETFRAQIDGLTVKGYLASDLSPNDPYIVLELADPTKVVVIVNTTHPHWSQLKGSDGVLNYLRHCTYDGISEWQASKRLHSTAPNTIKLLKDKLLRIPLDVEMIPLDEDRG